MTNFLILFFKLCTHYTPVKVYYIIFIVFKFNSKSRYYFLIKSQIYSKSISKFSIFYISYIFFSIQIYSRFNPLKINTYVSKLWFW